MCPDLGMGPSSEQIKWDYGNGPQHALNERFTPQLPLDRVGSMHALEQPRGGDRGYCGWFVVGVRERDRRLQSAPL
jgi:hypothetical protein